MIRIKILSATHLFLIKYFFVTNGSLLFPPYFINRYLIALHTTDYQQPMLFLNTLAVSVLVVAKLPNMHKVRIFGINAEN